MAKINTQNTKGNKNLIIKINGRDGSSTVIKQETEQLLEDAYSDELENEADMENELELSDVFTVMWKEIRTAVLCGITLAALCFVKVLLIDRLLMHNNSISLSVDLVICLALGVTVVIAKIVGCTLPLLAKKLGFDPAVMASPFITTIVDALSLLVYFLFAKTILGL